MVSLLLTVLNEESTIGALLDSVLEQTKKPDELVIVDGGSRDRTLEIIREYREKFSRVGVQLILRVHPGASIARGRNLGISIAKGPYIAVTDAGCRLDRSWLERIIEPLVAGRADLVGGFFLPVARTRFQRVLTSLTTSRSPTPNFLPSSRSVAFTKALWEKVGGYPEYLPWGEDTLFDRLCLEAGARYEVVADAIVYWEVRPTFRAALKQYFRYAFGDGLSGRFSVSHLILQGLYWGSLGAALVWGPLAFLPVLVYPAAWIVRRKVYKTVRLGDFPLAYSLALGIQLARFTGFSWGIIEKLRRRWRGHAHINANGKLRS